MRRIPREKRSQILGMLVEGNSIRATCRMSGASKTTVTRLLVDAGRVAAQWHGEHLRELPCRRVQVDEIWAFVGMKAANVPTERRGEFGIGDVYTFTAICADTRLAPTWYVGQRDGRSARRFLVDLGRRIHGRFQLTSDGASFYREAAADAFGPTVDYAQLVKRYAADVDGAHRYSPPACVGTDAHVIQGDPDPEHVSTSYVERANLTMRMSMRRFTRLTNAFSKKVHNLSCAVALHFMHYNLMRPHATLTKAANGKPTTPAMAAGLTTRVWTFNDLVDLIEAQEAGAKEVTARRFDAETGFHGERGSK